MNDREVSDTSYELWEQLMMKIDSLNIYTEGFASE